MKEPKNMMILSLQVFNGGMYLFSRFPRGKGIVIQADNLAAGKQRLIMLAPGRAAALAVDI